MKVRITLLALPLAAAALLSLGGCSGTVPAPITTGEPFNAETEATMVLDNVSRMQYK